LYHQTMLDSAREETIDLVLQLSHLLGANLGAVAGRFGLTPAQVRAVLALDQPAPMRDLAERLYCDKSNITGIVDGLEDRGLVERTSRPDDRRVKQLVLTEAGRRARADLRALLHGEAPGISRLTPQEEHQLRELLRRALAT
jgi:DNA-binding MarR family transcriptional regulator